MNSIKTRQSLNQKSNTINLNSENISKFSTKLIYSKVKCFHHCSSSIRYLCFDLPEKCPTCLEDFKLANIKFKVPPFILPPPIIISNKNATNLSQFSLLLQPTNGNYSNFIYSNLSDDNIGNLHIGVTNTRLEIFDYDSNGLNRNSNRWLAKPSIVLKLDRRLLIEQEKSNQKLQSNKNSSIENEYECLFAWNRINLLSLNEKWDLLLEEFWSEGNNKWSKINYNENDFNCFDFVVNFLFKFGYFDTNIGNDEDKEFAFNKMPKMNSFDTNNNKEFFNYLKEKISNDLIVKELRKFIKYLNFLIKLEKQKCLVERTSL